MSRCLGLCLSAIVVIDAGRVDAAPCPRFLLVMEHSASMAEDPDGHPSTDPKFHGPTKWDLAQQVSSDLVRASFNLPLGIELFATDAPMVMPGNEAAANQACFDATSITVEVSLDSAGKVVEAVTKAKEPRGVSNAGEAIRRGSTTMSLTGHPTFVPYMILVTDGHAECNSADRASSAADFTVAEIAAARARGVTTLVLSFEGLGTNTRALDAMARAGGSPTHDGCDAAAKDPCFFRAGINAFELGARVQTLAGTAVPPCSEDCLQFGCPVGQQCTTTELDNRFHCVPTNNCGQVACPGTTFCRDGQCRNSCEHGCPPGTTCSDGVCVPDRCADVVCPGARICRASDGRCVDPPCPSCPDGALCNADTGQCAPDWCKLVVCPDGYTCVNNGNCTAPFIPLDAGCSCALGSSSGGSLLAGLIALLLLLALARRPTPMAEERAALDP